jgi:hypothetical protein
MHRGAEIKGAMSGRGIGGTFDGALIFALTEPMVAPIEIGDERTVWQIDDAPVLRRRSFRGQTPEIPTAIQWKKLSHATVSICLILC